MAIYKEVYSEAITNAAAITKGEVTVSCLKVRGDYNSLEKYGPFNSLTLTNNSAQDAIIYWDIHGEGSQEKTVLKAGSTLNVTVDDGRKFYYFDVLNLDAGTDIAIGNIVGIARVIHQLPEYQYRG